MSTSNPPYEPLCDDLLPDRDTDPCNSTCNREDAIKAAINDYKKKRAAGAKGAGVIDVSQSVSTGETTATAHPGSAAH
jgi:hypothetical protein